jgi:hypothetical protein
MRCSQVALASGCCTPTPPCTCTPSQHTRARTRARRHPEEDAPPAPRGGGYRQEPAAPGVVALASSADGGQRSVLVVAAARERSVKLLELPQFAERGVLPEVRAPRAACVRAPRGLMRARGCARRGRRRAPAACPHASDRAAVHARVCRSCPVWPPRARARHAPAGQQVVDCRALAAIPEHNIMLAGDRNGTIKIFQWKAA